MRACAGCEELYSCSHGEKVVFGDMSISDKVIKLDYIETDTAVLRKMTIEELQEYNEARRVKEQMGDVPQGNNKLTAGYYDRDTDTWKGGSTKTEKQTAKDSGFTAGYYDSDKKRWVGIDEE